MNKHEQLLRQIAEEMSIIDWGQPDAFMKYLDYARIAVKHMAEIELQRDEAIELLHSIGMMLHDGDLVANSHTNDTYIRNKISKIIKRGLIPSPEGFHCNNKGLHFSDPGYKDVCATQCEACKKYVS